MNGERVFGIVTNASGVPVSGATITVYRQTGSPTVGTVTDTLATIYSDEQLTVAVANPLTAGTDGSFQFYAQAGQRLRMDAAASGAVTKSVTGIRLHADTAPYNYIFNEDMLLWGSGTDNPPTAWGLTGGTSTVAQSSISLLGARSALVTRNDTNAHLAQNLDGGVTRGLPPMAWWRGKTITFGAWCLYTASNGCIAHVSIATGGSDNESHATRNHSGTGAWEFLTTPPHLIGTDATQVMCNCSVERTDSGPGVASAHFTGATLIVGEGLTDTIPSGWKGRRGILCFPGSTNSVGAGVTLYLGSGISPTEDVVAPLLPFPAVLRNLQARASAAPGGTESYAYRIRTGSAATSVLAQTLPAAQQSSDTTREAYCPAATMVSVVLTTSAAAASAVHRIMLEYDEAP